MSQSHHLRGFMLPLFLIFIFIVIFVVVAVLVGLLFSVKLPLIGGFKQVEHKITIDILVTDKGREIVSLLGSKSIVTNMEMMGNGFAEGFGENMEKPLMDDMKILNLNYFKINTKGDKKNRIGETGKPSEEVFKFEVPLPGLQSKTVVEAGK